MTRNDSLSKLLNKLRAKYPNQKDFNRCVVNIFLNGWSETK